MSARQWEPLVVLWAAANIVLWTSGIILWLENDGSAGRVGFVLICAAATFTVLAVLRAWQQRMHRAFVHGYHAGWHDATKEVVSPGIKDCSVLDYAEIRARRLSNLG